jgi:MoxR-like ATPase
MQLQPEAELEGVRTEAVLGGILQQVRVPV